ncbi:hypothetical protein MMC28_008613 [Mycoblastus sanguinarius]|nr:hypothetical protein [Mycoblastus sanguinarius]
MSKKSHFTTVTALPAGITRETVLETLHNHVEMIDLNPLVTERHPIKAPQEASPEEFHSQWYSVTDKVNYLPGGLYTGSVTFNGCFHDLPNGLQTHIYAPMGLDMKGRWTLGGSLPGEPIQPVELGLGIPKTGLWLREDVTMKCNVVMTGFVKKTTKKAHNTLVQRLVEKAHLTDAEVHNNALAEQLSIRDSYPPDYHTGLSTPASAAGTSYPIEKPPVHSPPMSPPVGHRYSDTHSIGSAGSVHEGLNQSYYNMGSYEKVSPSYQDPMYGQGQGPAPRTSASYPRVTPQGQGPASRTSASYPSVTPQGQGPAPRTSASYPSVDPLFHNASQPHRAVELPSRGAVELSQQDTNTPIELDSYQRFP